MSLNTYNPSTQALTNIASGSRIWTGTKEEWQALVNAGTAPKNCLVAITNDEQAPSSTVEEDDENAVQGGAVYDACTRKFSSGNYVGVDELAYDTVNKRLGLKVGGADTVIPFSSFPSGIWGLYYVYPPNNSGKYCVTYGGVNAEEVSYSTTGTIYNGTAATIVNNGSHSFTFTFKKRTYVSSGSSTLLGWHDANTSVTVTGFFQYGATGYYFD